MSEWEWLEKIEDNLKWVTTDYDGMKDAVIFSKEEVPKLITCIKEMRESLEECMGPVVAVYSDEECSQIYSKAEATLTRCAEGKFE